MYTKKQNSISMTQSLESYISQLKMRMSQETVNAYRSDLHRFLSYLESQGVKRMFKTQHIASYMQQQQQAGKGNSALARSLVSIRSLCKWLKRMKLVDEDIAENIECPKADNVCPLVPTHQEINELLNMPDL